MQSTLDRVCKIKKIIIYVLPANSSHLLQPMDFGVFKPFKTAYSDECQLLLPTYVGRQFSSYDICILACKTYPKAIPRSNITSAFGKNDIWPLGKVVISDKKRAPNINTTISPETDKNVK